MQFAEHIEIAGAVVLVLTDALLLVERRGLAEHDIAGRQLDGAEAGGLVGDGYRIAQRAMRVALAVVTVLPSGDQQRIRVGIDSGQQKSSEKYAA